MVEGTELATPTFKQQVALDAQTGRRPLDAERARVLYKCTDCHATVDACRHRIAVSTSLREARAVAVREGVAPPEIAELAERFAAHGSPYSRDLGAAAEEALAGVEPPARSGGVAVFAGCTALARSPGELRAAVRVLRRLGEDPSLALPSPPCCGYPLDAAGLDDAFAAHARRVADALASFEEVSCLGPACAWTLQVRYREVGIALRPRVTPFVDRLAAHAGRIGALAAERRRADAGEPPRLAYHDPCFLARRLRRTQEPREVIAAALGAPPLELAYARESTVCSGGGGNYPLTHPAESRGCAARLAAFARETGAAGVITACATDRHQLTEAGIDAISLAELVAERIGAS